jgi:hypothetical protein
VALQPFTLQHPQDHHSCAAFAVIVFEGAVWQQNRPCVMRGFGEFLAAAQGFDKGFRLVG